MEQDFVERHPSGRLLTLGTVKKQCLYKKNIFNLQIPLFYKSVSKQIKKQQQKFVSEENDKEERKGFQNLTKCTQCVWSKEDYCNMQQTGI